MGMLLKFGQYAIRQTISNRKRRLGYGRDVILPALERGAKADISAIFLPAAIFNSSGNALA
jgi:hypothetical protein